MPLDAQTEGRLAALELVAQLGMLGWAQRNFASAWPNHLPGVRTVLAAMVQAGTLPGPADPDARAAMLAGMERLMDPAALLRLLPRTS